MVGERSAPLCRHPKPAVAFYWQLTWSFPRGPSPGGHLWDATAPLPCAETLAHSAAPIARGRSPRRSLELWGGSLKAFFPDASEPLR